MAYELGDDLERLNFIKRYNHSVANKRLSALQIANFWEI